MNWLYNLNFLLAVSGLALLIFTTVLYIDYYFYQRKFFILFVSRYVWPSILTLTAGSVFLSLLYSEYFGFVPCSLCWLQRIALYPQALLAILAFRTRESIFYPTYSLALSIFGLCIAVYHYIYQLLPKEVSTTGLLPCLADGSSDCATLVINEFGFVTFPFLSAITFACLIIMYLNLRKSL